MSLHPLTSQWWGPPKDLMFRKGPPGKLAGAFYDLVYVIAIARITHHLAHHVTLGVSWNTRDYLR